ncbi:transglycosylase domain-containing protein [Leifsonia poae]|uniref:transglycosylase domain-containing protein n=1 Tax=Leifsonia poae TaxID=110933 RepID=UPI001CBE5519|nr:transglycosylase domain-containing protein [Leifsonia poae]
MRVRRMKVGELVGAWAAFVGGCVVAAILVAVGVTPSIAMTSLSASAGAEAFNGLPSYLKIQPLDQTTTFYATKGGQPVPIATFYDQNRVDVTAAQIPGVLGDALLATEDPNFYNEGGIDVSGTIRALVENSAGGDTQGGSSITQQYVKNVLVQRCETMTVNPNAAKAVYEAQEKAYQSCYDDVAGPTLARKIRELRYAIGLDKSYSKQQILVGYLNIVGFGGQVYGVQAAAQYYFGVDSDKLTLDESATLVAILNDPSNLRLDQSAADNPGNNAANHFKETLARRDYVLKRMLTTKKITDQQYKAAVAAPITPTITPVPSGCQSASASDAGFFCDYVQDVILNDKAFGATADDRAAFFRTGGLKVYTTLNLDMQNTAQTSLSAYIPSTDPDLDLGAADVSMQPGSGRILNMVQNRPFDDSATPPAGATAINYSTDYDYGGSGGFQTGSSFKAFDLVAWLEAGHSLNEIVNASQHEFSFSDFPASCTDIGQQGWDVQNDESTETGNMSVLEATEASVNTAFADMATQLDLCNISSAAQSLLVHTASPSEPWQLIPSMILGVNEVSPLTMATAYAGIANGGKVCTPIAIDRVVTSDGKDHAVPASTCTQAITPQIADGVVYALRHVMTNGTATTANPFDGSDIMGKTGTTDNSEQNWLVTSTTTATNALWVGNVSGHVALRSQYFQGIDGGDVKFSIDKPILAALDATYPGTAFPAPPSSMVYGSNSYSNPSTPSTPAPSTTQAPASPAPSAPAAPTGPAIPPTTAPNQNQNQNQ